MPQLKSDIADAIDETVRGAGVLDPGVYEVRLVSVEARPGRVAPVWSWRFVVDNGYGEGRTLFQNTSLSEDARWKMKETFDAFGVPATTDTDLLIGRVVKALVFKSIAEQGKRQGQFVNGIQELMPVGRRTLGPDTKAAKAAPRDPDDPTAPRTDGSEAVKVGTASTDGDDEPPF